MILWLNGAFGAGKTTCAHELNRRLPSSFVYDPEAVGSFIRQNTPKTFHKSNFQDHPEWRLFNYKMLKALSSSFDGTIIVPMTLINFAYFEEIIGRLQKDGIPVQHYILYAEKKTLQKRLHKRMEWGNTWAKRHIDLCIHAFDHEITDQKIQTDNKSIDCIIEEIAIKSGLSLMPNARSTLRKCFVRMRILLKRI